MIIDWQSSYLRGTEYQPDYGLGFLFVWPGGAAGPSAPGMPGALNWMNAIKLDIVPEMSFSPNFFTPMALW